jgi:hypothetical protein
MDIKDNIDAAVDAISNNKWEQYYDELEENLISDLGPKVKEEDEAAITERDIKIREIKTYLNKLKSEAEFKSKYNADDYVQDAQANNNRGHYRNISRNLRRAGVADNRISSFIREIKAKVKGTVFEDLEAILKITFTVDGRPMVIGDLDDVESAVPNTGIDDYELKLGHLRGVVYRQREESIPDGSIEALVDKFESLYNGDERAIIPKINLKGFFTESGLFTGLDVNDRDEIYNYWEHISTLYESFEDSIDILLPRLDAQSTDEEKRLFESWQKLKKVGSYVRIVDKKMTKIPDLLNSVNIFVSEYLNKIGAGITEEYKETTTQHRKDKDGNVSDNIAEGDFDGTKDTLDYIMDDVINTKELDPILRAQYLSNNQKAIISKNDIERARKLVQSVGKRVGITDELLESMNEYYDYFIEEVADVDELEDNFRTGFYLPVNSSTFDNAIVGEINDVYSEFFELFATFILRGRSKLPTSGQFTGNRVRGDVGVTSTPQSAQLGEKGLKESYSDWSGALVNNVKFEIYDYLIAPINSGKYFGDKPAFVNSGWFTDFNRNIESDPYGTTLDMTLSMDTFTAADLDNIADMIELLGKGREIYASIISDIEAGVDALNDVLGDKKENLWLGGHVLYLYDSEGKIEGKTASELHEKFMQSNKGIIFEQLDRLINSYQFKSRLKVRENTKQDKVASAFYTTKVINLRPSHVAKPELLESAQRILNVLENATKSVMKAHELLMDAHDVIRKMKNKPIVFGHLKLNDIDNVDFILKQVPRYDLSVLELQEIILDLDSFANIAKTYGIDEDAVYTIKGLCRGIY